MLNHLVADGEGGDLTERDETLSNISLFVIAPRSQRDSHVFVIDLSCFQQ